MKRTISIIVFVVVLPVVAFTVAYFIVDNKEKPIIGKRFPDIPVDAVGKRWMAVFSPGIGGIFIVGGMMVAGRFG